MIRSLTHGLVCLALIGTLASGASAQSRVLGLASGTATEINFNYGGIQSQDFQQVAAAKELIRAGQEQKALALLTPLYSRGFAPAVTVLGSMYAAGRGVDRNEVYAADLYAKASASGDPYAMYLYGYALDNGIGVTRDRNAAMMWMQRASDSGNIDLQKAVRAYRQRAAI